MTCKFTYPHKEHSYKIYWYARKLLKQVVAKILSLGADPRQQDCKALRGIDGGFHADQGEFRILYCIQAATNEQLGQVQIFRVGKRNDDEVYRNL